MTIFAFQGEKGAYSEQACLEYKRDCQTLPCQNFESVLKAVKENRANYAMLPVCNSSAGAVIPALQALSGQNVKVVDSFALPVHHCLLAWKGAELSSIQTVHSHSQALLQCKDNINALNINPVEEYDTAGAAKMLAEVWKDKNRAVIASNHAAELYNLDILKFPFNDNPDNITFFAIVSNS